jgi:hypothetical protein
MTAGQAPNVSPLARLGTHRWLAVLLWCACASLQATEFDYPNATGRTISKAASQQTRLQAGAEVALSALAYLGVPYRYGGDDPRAGFDCSGLVRHVFLSVAALELPRSVEEQRGQGRAIKRAALAVGDLVFFDTRGWPFSHVAIYLGEGRFVHAPGRGGQVRINELTEPYWRARYNGARRVLRPSSEMAADSAQRSAERARERASPRTFNPAHWPDADTMPVP